MAPALLSTCGCGGVLVPVTRHAGGRPARVSVRSVRRVFGADSCVLAGAVAWVLAPLPLLPRC
jgi:hypothetical protein